MTPHFTHKGSMTNLLGKNLKQKKIDQYSNDLQLFNDVPQVFQTLSNEDTAVPPINGLNYYQECNNNGIPDSIQIYPTGGH